MKLKKWNLGKLFYNNRFLLVFSVVVALLIWLFVSVEFGPDITRTIHNVPVQIDFSRVEENLGLSSFGNGTYTVDVTISGKRYIVEQDDVQEDLVVTANTGYVNAVGTYSLPVTVESASTRPSYIIEGWSLPSVDVYFDYPKVKEFAVEADIQTDGDLVPEGYFTGDYIFAESTTVRVSGPETEVNKIDRVVARAAVEKPLTANTTLDATLVSLTKEGGTPKYVTYNRQSEVAHVTIPVYKRATLPATVGFSNLPADYLEQVPFSVTVSPETAEFGVAESKLADLESFEIAVIPFSSIHDGETVLEISAADLTGGVIADDTASFTVTIRAEDMATVTLAAPASLNFINVPEDVSAETEMIHFDQITLVGPAATLAALTAETLVLNADLSAVPDGVTGTVVVPVTVPGSDYWAYGDYTASVLLR